MSIITMDQIAVMSVQYVHYTTSPSPVYLAI